MKKILLTFFLLLFIFLPQAFSQEPVQLRAAIHLSSQVSEGSYPLHMLAALAQDNGIAVLIITDRDLMQWEYGLWPLRKVIKKTVKDNSVFRYGIKRYLSEIDVLQKRFPRVVIVPGIESAPFYYWQGSPVKSTALQGNKTGKEQLEELRRKLNGKRKNLTMYNWHRHMLTLGLEQYADYRNLPLIGNPHGLRQGFAVAMLIWPLALLAVGIWGWFAKKKIHKAQKIIASLAVATGLIFFCNNWPFLRLKFDQYHDSGDRPYQNYIDYVNAKGGMVFWAHPEAESDLNMAGIDFFTAEHSGLLSQTRDYAGFCVFPDGYKQIGKPKGLWDELLMEYCRGVRKSPVWAIAGLAFEKGDLSRAMKNRQTVILSTGTTREQVLQALRNGKMYSVEGEHSLDFSLDDFYVTDSGGKAKGIVGDSVKISGKPLINISGRFGERQDSVEIKVLRNGRIFKRYILHAPFNIVCTDEEAPDTGATSYYRLEITSKGLRLITNPVFVRRF